MLKHHAGLKEVTASGAIKKRYAAAFCRGGIRNCFLCLESLNLPPENSLILQHYCGIGIQSLLRWKFRAKPQQTPRPPSCGLQVPCFISTPFTSRLHSRSEPEPAETLQRRPLPVISWPYSVVQSHFGSLGCFRKPWKVACLWRSEATQLSRRNSCTSVFWAEQSTPSPLPELELLLPTVFEAKERGTAPAGRKNWNAFQSRSYLLLPASLLLPPLDARAQSPSRRVQLPGHPQTPSKQAAGPWKCQSPTFSELFSLACVWVKLSCVFSRKAEVSF